VKTLAYYNRPVKPLDPFKQRIISNIDNLRDVVSGFEKEEIEDALNDGHLFHYKIDKLRNGGKEYTILTTITVTQNEKVKDKPLLTVQG
jgi:hypothetical protein